MLRGDTSPEGAATGYLPGIDRLDLPGLSFVDGPLGIRAKPMQVVINRLFPHLSRPILPGFNLVVPRNAYERSGGFPDVPNEDTALGRRLARIGETASHPDCLVETASRRFREQGLTGTTYHYVRLDLGRFRADY